MTQRKVWERMWTHMSLSLVPAEKAQKWASWWCAKNNSLYLQESALYTQIIAEISTQIPSQSSHRDYSTDGETEPRWKAPSLKTLSFSMKEGMHENASQRRTCLLEYTCTCMCFSGFPNLHAHWAPSRNDMTICCADKLLNYCSTT